MKKKLCYVVSDIDSSHLIDSTVRFLDETKYELTTIFLGSQIPNLYETLKNDGFPVRFLLCRGKKDLIKVTLDLLKIFGEIKPDIVHTHLFFASIVGQTAAKIKGIKKRINTRHHSVEAHLYHPHAVYYDKYVNSLATHIIAITDLVADVLSEKESVPRDKISVIRHAFDLRAFEVSREKPGGLKEKYGLTNDSPIIGVISRHIHWKGIQYIIPAFRKILVQHPNAKLVLANATGSYKTEISELLHSLPSDRYLLIEFEREVFDLYKTFDVFVHAPIGREYEAFGQVYVEALAMGIPSVFTLSGVANDFIVDKYNAAVVPFEDSNSIAEAISLILEDSRLRQALVQNGIESVNKIFGIDKMIDMLDVVYS